MRCMLAIMFFAGSAMLSAQVKKQVFVGSGVVTPWDGGSRTVSTTGGVALVVPLTQKLFMRPVVGAGSITSVKTGRSFPTIQAACLVGWRVTKRTAILGGGGSTFLFPPMAPNRVLPTAIFSTATQIHGRWAVFTPVSFNEKGIGVAAQIGYTW